MNDYCEHCGIDMGLHPDPDDTSGDSCDAAEHKARVLERFADLYTQWWNGWQR